MISSFGIFALIGLVSASAMATQAGHSPRARSGRPNVVYIMADDLEADYKQDRLAIMPNLAKLAARGVELVNHVAAQPVCGPSRAGILTGRYAHNNGYKANSDQKSLEAFKKIGNNTVGTWASAAGYHTSFIGKMVNGAESTVFSGWSHWRAFSSSKGTYNFRNATAWDVHFTGPNNHEQVGPARVVNMHDIHQADFVGNFTLEEAQAAKEQGKPFFISVTPVMVHWGTCVGPCPGGGQECYAPDDPHWEWNIPMWNDPTKFLHFPSSPCPRFVSKERFRKQALPEQPSYNKSASGGESTWMEHFLPLTAQQHYRQELAFRNRSSSATDLDHMIGVIVDGLESMGVLNDTVIIFTSDNGYHLGEHKLPFGKTEPYTTDTWLPFYAAGPGIARGERRPHPTNHIDITATLVDLMGATPQGPPLDGKSFVSVLGESPPSVDEWRPYVFSEFWSNNNTWASIRFPSTSPTIGRHQMARSLHRWCTDDLEVYDMEAGDIYQMHNVKDTPAGKEMITKYLPMLSAFSNCTGSDCLAPKGDTVSKLHCYPVIKTEEFDYDVPFPFKSPM